MEDRIPMNGKKPLLIILMLGIGFLFVASSVLGISFPHTRYPNPDLYTAFLPNDYANLLVGIPLLVVSTIHYLRNRNLGLIGWYASLLFILYNGIAYAIDLGDTFSKTIYTVITLASCIELVLLARSPIARCLVPREFPVQHPRRYGLIPFIMGLLFEIRALAIIFSMLSKDTTNGLQGFGVHIADAMTSLVWIVSGALLLLGRKIGYTMALISYLHGSLLFVALLVYLCLKPLLCETPFLLMDVIVIGVMGLLFFLPTVRLLPKSLNMSNS